jgi:hypothetical protein
VVNRPAPFSVTATTNSSLDMRREGQRAELRPQQADAADIAVDPKLRPVFLIAPCHSRLPLKVETKPAVGSMP